MNKICYYKLVRLEDDYTVEGAFFQNADSEGELKSFPPQEGCIMIVFNDVFNYLKTTTIQHIVKKTEDEFEVTTLDSIYRVTREFLEI